MAYHNDQYINKNKVSIISYEKCDKQKQNINSLKL